MSLRLEDGTTPKGLMAKTWGPNEVELGKYVISMNDFMALACYVMTNSDLSGKNDPRLKFIKTVKSMKSVKGFTKGLKRLEIGLPRRQKKSR